MPEKELNECNPGRDKNVTLQWLIEDYVRHLEYHLKQITNWQEDNK